MKGQLTAQREKIDQQIERFIQTLYSEKETELRHASCMYLFNIHSLISILTYIRYIFHSVCIIH